MKIQGKRERLYPGCGEARGGIYVSTYTPAYLGGGCVPKGGTNGASSPKIILIYARTNERTNTNDDEIISVEGYRASLHFPFHLDLLNIGYAFSFAIMNSPTLLRYVRE